MFLNCNLIAVIWPALINNWFAVTRAEGKHCDQSLCSILFFYFISIFYFRCLRLYNLSTIVSRHILVTMI